MSAVSSFLAKRPDGLEMNRFGQAADAAPGGGRIEWIDSLRGVGILLVCLGHSGLSYVLGPAKLWIFSFHLPLFFLISGMLFREDKYPFAVFLKKRASSLLWPYLTFSFLCALLYAAIPRHPAWRDILWNCVYGYGPEDGLALWFLPALFLLECVYFLLMKVVRGRILRTGLLLFAALAAFFLSRTGLQLPWNAEVIPAALVFFGAGHLYFHPEKLDRWKMGKAIGAFVLFLAASVVLGRMVQVDMRTNRYAPYALFYIAAFSGILATVSGILAYAILSRGNKTLEWGTRFLVFTGRNTIPILALHQPVFRLASRLDFLPGTLQKVLAGCVLYLIVFLMKKYFPFFLKYPKKQGK